MMHPVLDDVILITH